MLLAIWLTVVTLAAVSLGAALLVRRGVVPLSLTSFVSFAIVALQSRNIVLFHQDGTSTVVGSVSVQFLLLMLALIAFSVLVAAVWWDSFPSNDRDRQEMLS